MNNRLLPLLLATALSTSGCYRMTFSHKELQPVKKRPLALIDLDENAQFSHAIVYGLIEVGDTPNPYTLCPEGFAQVHTRQSLLDAFLTRITFSMYMPRSVSVACATTEPGTAALAPAP